MSDNDVPVVYFFFSFLSFVFFLFSIVERYRSPDLISTYLLCGHILVPRLLDLGLHNKVHEIPTRSRFIYSFSSLSVQSAYQVRPTPSNIEGPTYVELLMDPLSSDTPSRGNEATFSHPHESIETQRRPTIPNPDQPSRATYQAIELLPSLAQGVPESMTDKYA